MNVFLPWVEKFYRVHVGGDATYGAYTKKLILFWVVSVQTIFRVEPKPPFQPIGEYPPILVWVVFNNALQPRVVKVKM